MFGRRVIVKQLQKSLHFADATEDLKFAFVERLQSLPLEGYIAMVGLPTAARYEATYLRLLKAMIRRRLMAAESQAAHLFFEQNDKVSQAAIRKAVMDTFDFLRESNNRHPEECYVEFVEKPDLGISPPDFLLGVLGSGLIVYSQKMTVAAMQMAAMKVWAHRS